MPTGLAEFPFTQLKLPAGETVLWNASNPTFHRSWDYGLALTAEAFYLFHPFWLWFARWRRVPLASITSAEFRDSRWSPCLIIRCSERSIHFRTPYDHKDEMAFDRMNLQEATAAINQAIASRGRG